MCTMLFNISCTVYFTNKTIGHAYMSGFSVLGRYLRREITNAHKKKGICRVGGGGEK